MCFITFLNRLHRSWSSCRSKNHPKRHCERILLMKRTVRSYLKPYWPAFSFALGQVLFISALELLKPWPLKIIIDNVLSGKPLPWGPAVGWSPYRLLLFSCIGLLSDASGSGRVSSALLRNCTFTQKNVSGRNRGSSRRKHGLFRRPANALGNARDPGFYKGRGRGATLSAGQYGEPGRRITLV